MKESERTILLRKYGEGAVDCFYDVLFLEREKDGSYIVEASIEGDPYDMDVNKYGETKIDHFAGVWTGEQLFSAINTLTSDSYCRWDHITST